MTSNRCHDQFLVLAMLPHSPQLRSVDWFLSGMHDHDVTRGARRARLGTRFDPTLFRVASDSNLGKLMGQFQGDIFRLVGGTVINDKHFEVLSEIR
eukprot:gnl/TRDRNA2_/TRDRNA2_220044_c0_seq1.p2 gnl/TRDRNA2_/TRDRNA2_220044_c0~~gnl/TRDRNA2_/TRDRNA2_220044_c0_seq1.p2  ORF type:complete len:109 (+),score=19.86 gnl/TRDRNA2_/TRDRNA2_220044_c0_seq1:42-329(+)